MIEIERLLERGSLGTPMHVEANFSHDLLADLDPGDWRAARSESALPAHAGMGIHITDSFLQLFGRIEHVFARSTRRSVRWGAGDTLSVLLEFRSGLTGYFNAILATPLFVRFHVFGARGWVEARSDVHPAAQSGATRLTVRQSQASPESRELQPVDTVRANLEAFADAVIGAKPYPFTDAEKLGNIAVMEAIAESASEGRRVSVAETG